jgi:hypothetical protein
MAFSSPTIPAETPALRLISRDSIARRTPSGFSAVRHVDAQFVEASECRWDDWDPSSA